MLNESPVAHKAIQCDEKSVCEIKKEIKLLSFMLDNHEYAVEAVNTIEILRLVAIIPIPEAPTFVPGIINLRGRIIPILDLRLRFGFPHKYYNLNTPIIIATNGSYMMGIIVDQVKEVFNITPANIAAEHIMPGAQYLKGVAKCDSHLLLIVNLKNLLDDSEEKSLQAGLAGQNKDAAEFKETDSTKVYSIG